MAGYEAGQAVRLPGTHVTTLAVRWSTESSWEVVPRVANPGRKGIGHKVLTGLLVAFMFTQLSVFAVQNVNLAWNQSTDPSIVGYNIYYGPGSGNYTNSVTVGNINTASVPGLIAGATYYFAATCYDTNGVESLYSHEISYTVPNAVTGPAVLSIQIVSSNGVPSLASITATGTVPNTWALQSSPDLTTWTTIQQGTNLAVNVSVPVNGQPAQFFRLFGQ